MSKNFRDVPLSESNVSLKLAEIQKRCSELLEDDDTVTELCLEETALELDDTNPYSRG